MTRQRVLITSALPYANGQLHFGHIAGAYLPADCYARYRRLKGDEVLYVCGSDEYGIAITLNADKQGIPYQDYVDMYYQSHKATFQRLNFSFDHYSRTTNPFHKDVVQQFYSQLKTNGYITLSLTEQLYSEEDAKFLADRYVEGICPRCGFEEARGDECQRCGASYEATELKNPRSKISQSALTIRETEHAFLRLDLLQQQLFSFLDRLQITAHVKNFVLEYLHNLKPRAITRDLQWGVCVPDMPGKVFYVWFDAPIGYISATMEWAHEKGEPDAWQAYWLNESSEYVQFIGKDNTPFHAIVFPAMQMGQDVPYKKVDRLVVSEFYLLEGKKFSKTDGNYIDLHEFLDQFKVDQLRYFLAATHPENSDSEFTHADFKNRCNVDLVGKLGNFYNRVLAFAQKNGFCNLRFCQECYLPQDKQFLEEAYRCVKNIEQAYHDVSLRRAVTAIMELASLGNAYVNDQAPWACFKEGSQDRVQMILFCACLCQKWLGLTICPLMPETAGKIARMLSWSPVDDQGNAYHWSDAFFDIMHTEFHVQNTELLFSIVE